MKTEPYQYKAFISYRHVDRDRRWAKWLIDKLETYRVPRALVQEGYPQRVGRLFRDDDEIPASSDLSDQIQQALEASEFLIVICSPDMPHSKWVRKEIEIFKKLGRGDKILALLVEGEPAESFPPELRFVETEVGEREEVEPIAADVRPRQDESRKDTERRALLRIISGFLACSYDALVQRDMQRARTRQRRVATFASAAALLFAAIAGVAGWQWNEARLARDDAEDALAAATKTAYDIMIDLGSAFEGRSIPTPLVRQILQRASELQSELLQGAPNNPELLYNRSVFLIELGDVQQKQDTTGDAATSYEKALSIAETFHERQPKDPKWAFEAARASVRLGDLNVVRRDFDESRRSYDRALSIAERFSKPNADARLWGGGIKASANLGLGDVLLAASEPKRAHTHYLAARNLVETTYDDTSLNEGQLIRLSQAVDRIGRFQRVYGELEEAIKTFRLMLSLRERLAARDEFNIDHMMRVAVALNRLAVTSGELGKPHDAISYTERAQDLTRRALKIDPSNKLYVESEATGYVALGKFYAQTGQYTRAFEYYLDALVTLEKLAAEDPGNSQLLNKVMNLILSAASASEKANILSGNFNLLEKLIQAARNAAAH